MATKRKKPEYSPEPRVLFNWGFHDGAHEFRMFGGESPIRAEGWRQRTPVYAAGYEYGQAIAKTGGYDFERGTLSTEAWKRFRASKRSNEVLSMAPSPEPEYVDAVEEANKICDMLERETKK